MEIKRIDTYDDARFSKSVLLQHGCFLVDEVPYEVEIISESEAVIRGAEQTLFPMVIDEFRFYTPHIVIFYDNDRNVIKAFPNIELLKISLDQIQPSQFYVDRDKIAAISNYIHEADDIVIQVMSHQNGFISLDGHTRLYYAAMKGWRYVRAVEETSDDWVYRFVAEAQKRNIYTPKDMMLVSHEEYEEKWNRFCDEIFADAEE
ncbi:MAG: hypothetical protein HDR18_09600 [Lachnospiraceae bacterium]|nr:hypothetical protein [Lachnospiraceae bacterium]MBD5526138.1 hypothetical protein [Lachnospiraceae bacterium]